MSAPGILAAALMAAALAIPTQAQEFTARFEMCGSQRYTCVVDGDTIWLQGVNLRLESFDTPEPHTAICGGTSEVALARRASARLLELLNSNPFTVQTGGTDRYGPSAGHHPNCRPRRWRHPH